MQWYKKQKSDQIELESLDIVRDWGFAGAIQTMKMILEITQEWLCYWDWCWYEYRRNY